MGVDVAKARHFGGPFHLRKSLPLANSGRRCNGWECVSQLATELSSPLQRS
jgi:hypothetical protein